MAQGKKLTEAERERRYQQGQRIRIARLLAGLTEAELAGAVGVVVTTVDRWENGRTTPSVEDIISVSRVLHVPQDELSRPDLMPERMRQMWEELNAHREALDDRTRRMLTRTRHLLAAAGVQPVAALTQPVRPAGPAADV